MSGTSEPELHHCHIGLSVHGFPYSLSKSVRKSHIASLESSKHEQKALKLPLCTKAKI